MKNAKGKSSVPAFALAAALLFSAGSTAPAAAQQSGGLTYRAFEAGIGFTADPETFHMALGLPLGITRNVSIVPSMQLGFADHWTIVAPSADLRYVFSFDGRSEREIHRLRPYLQGGIGLAYVDHRRRDGVGFLMNGGFGVEYPLNESAALVSSMRFNGVPDGAGGEHFFYSWQLLGAQLRF